MKTIMLALCCLQREILSFTGPVSLSSSSIRLETRRIQRCCSARNPSLMLDDVLRGNDTSASAIIRSLDELRGTEKMDQFLSKLMPPEVNEYPLWVRLPLSRFSRRARKLRLRKLLELTTPSADSAMEDDEESKQRRARRALFVLLRNINENPDNDFKGVSELLAKARRDATDVIISSDQLLKRTPDLETPRYKVLSSGKGGLEIRQYEQYSVCSVTMKDLNSSTGSDRESAAKISNPHFTGATSFGALAGYLFGKNQAEKAMKMTTPVLTEGAGSEKKMSFILPSDYWTSETMKDVPMPLSDSAVKIDSVDSSLRAVLAFGGYGGKLDAMSTRLLELLKKDDHWRAVEYAPVTLAQYNDPFTPPWRRRNEVSVLVSSRE